MTSKMRIFLKGEEVSSFSIYDAHAELESLSAMKREIMKPSECLKVGMNSVAAS